MEGGVKGPGSSGVVHHPPADVITPSHVMAGPDPAIPTRGGAALLSIGITGTSPVITSENVAAVPEHAPAIHAASHAALIPACAGMTMSRIERHNPAPDPGSPLTLPPG